MENDIHGGHRDRLRRSYLDNGSDALNDLQLLELLLTYAVPRRDTNPIAHALLERFGSLSGVLQADRARLMTVSGIGEHTAALLTLVGDAAKRTELDLLASRGGKTVLGTPLAAARYASVKTRGEGREVVLVACLNVQCEVIACERLQTGTLTEAAIYPRAVAETALLHRAHSVVLIHNHPSGDPTASEADAGATEAVRDALRVIGIPLRDHLIAAGRYVFSFSANGIIDIAGGSDASAPNEETDFRRLEA